MARQKRGSIAFKGHYNGTVIVPDEPVTLPADCTLAIRVEVMPPAKQETKKRKQPSVLEWIAANPIDDPAMPADFSANLDHYLYGSPKKKSDKR